jgi:hypothetical protein
VAQLVLAIEPDLRQAAIVKRIVREKVLADVAVVDSRDAAMDAMRTMIPDVLLLSALMSPRDEDELFAHLRTLEHADHLQTHTIPQLASTLNTAESREPRGLLSAFRRKKDPEAAPSGCDPDLFAEEIRVFLQRAADKKRERLAAGPGAAPADTGWRAAQAQRTAAPIVDQDATPEPDAAASSSWASPFEWKPSTTSSPMIDPDATAAPPESLMAHLRPPSGIPSVVELTASSRAQEFAAEPVPVAAPVEESFEAFRAVPEPVAVVPPPVVAAAPRVVAAAPPVVPVAAPVVAAPVVAARPVVAAPPVVAARPVVAAPPVIVTPAPVVAAPPPVAVAPPAVVAAAPVRDSRSTSADRKSRIPDSGLGIREQRLAMSDRKLGALASWARSEDRGRTPAPGSDDLRALLTGLAVPSAVVSVGYGRGCRIRRVRVPAAREPQETEAVGAVILSRRVLAEQRGQQPQV